ncbi:hypothetical protein NSQ26_07200 [Bacillus sp. FSL W7-1360]
MYQKLLYAFVLICFVTLTSCSGEDTTTEEGRIDYFKSSAEITEELEETRRKETSRQESIKKLVKVGDVVENEYGTVTLKSIKSDLFEFKRGGVEYAVTGIKHMEVQSTDDSYWKIFVGPGGNVTDVALFDMLQIDFIVKNTNNFGVSLGTINRIMTSTLDQLDYGDQNVVFPSRDGEDLPEGLEERWNIQYSFESSDPIEWIDIVFNSLHDEEWNEIADSEVIRITF